MEFLAFVIISAFASYLFSYLSIILHLQLLVCVYIYIYIKIELHVVFRCCPCLAVFDDGLNQVILVRKWLYGPVMALSVVSLLGHSGA